MTDQTPRDGFSAVTGDDPDAATLARMRARLEQALDEHAGSVAPRNLNQGREIVVLQLDERTEPVDTKTKRQTPRWLLAAAALLVLAIGVGVVQTLRDDGDDVRASSDDAEGTPEQTVDGGDAPSEIPAFGRPVPPGTYATDQFGVALSFEVPADATGWTVLANNSTGFAVEESGAGLVGFTRIGGFFDAAQAIEPTTTGVGNIPPNAIDVWIAATGAVVTEAGETQIAGRAAAYRRLAAPAGAGVDTGLCPEEAIGCLLFSSASADLIDASQIPSVTVGATPASFWIVDLDEFEPFGIWVSAPPTNDGWFDLVQPLLDSIELGEPAPASEDGIARVAESAEFSATYTGTRASGPTDDATGTVAGTSTLTGAVAGDLASAGTTITPENRFDDAVFTGTIDGVGTGTLIVRQDWSITGVGGTTAYVTGGTGDFAGATGEITISPDGGDAGATTGQMTFELAIPSQD